MKTISALVLLGIFAMAMADGGYEVAVKKESYQTQNGYNPGYNHKGYERKTVSYDKAPSYGGYNTYGRYDDGYYGDRSYGYGAPYGGYGAGYAGPYNGFNAGYGYGAGYGPAYGHGYAYGGPSYGPGYGYDYVSITVLKCE